MKDRLGKAEKVRLNPETYVGLDYFKLMSYPAGYRELLKVSESR